MSLAQSQNELSRGDHSWGDHSLLLALPFANVQLTGLSHRQATTLRDAYCQFVDDATVDNDAWIDQLQLECRAYRLQQPPSLSAQELTNEGQYAPKKQRNFDSIGLTGINFEAELRLQPSLPPSRLGVLEEHELANANVIENFLRFLAAHRALEQGGIVLHSAGLVFANKAYIFVGRSNAGKTTLTRKAYQAGAKVLSDDINILLPDQSQSGFNAHAVPFTGEFGRTLSHQGGRESFSIAGIALLEQGDQLTTRSISTPEAIAKLLVGSPFVNTDEHESTALFDSLTGLLSKVPVFKLINRRDDDIDAIMKLVTERIVHDCGLR